MKATTILFCALMLAAGHSNVFGQIPPPGAGDKSLEDRNIKGRSIELERIKRDADKPDSNNKQQVPASKFREIKEDFEQIQISQTNIITAYTKVQVIDFAKISENAQEINKRGIRLKANLFPTAGSKDDKKSKDKKKSEEVSMPQDVKTLIIDLDNTLAAFTGNPMFTNPQVVNADSNTKALAELAKLIKLSSALQEEANKASKQRN